MSLVNQYLEYMRPLKGSRRFHIWSILTVAAAVLERRVWLDRGLAGPTFPNLYTILVCRPGKGKGFAVIKARTLLDDLVYPNGTIPIKLGSTKITPAALYKQLEQAERPVCHSFVQDPELQQFRQCPLFIAADELGQYMEDFGGGALTNELLVFWDSTKQDIIMEKDIVSDKRIVLKNPSLTILGATNTDFLKGASSSKLLTSGLASRMLFIVDPGKIAKQHRPVPLNPTAKAGLQAILKGMFLMCGPMKFDKDGEDCYEQLAEAADVQGDSTQSSFLQEYFGRKAINLSKVAIVIAASEGRKTITRTDIEQAHAYLLEVEPDMRGAFGLRSLGRDDNAGQKVLEHIPLLPERITQEDLFKSLEASGWHMPLGTVFKELIASFESSGSVVVSRGGPIEIYSRTKDL